MVGHWCSLTHPIMKRKKDLDGLVRVVLAVHEQEKRPMADVGLCINTVVLPVNLAALRDNQEHVMHEGRTYYDVYKENGLRKQG